MQVKRFQHGTIDPAAQETRDRLVRFLDVQLRPNESHSLKAEYPSVFGEFPGGESLFIESEGQVASHACFLIREFQNEDRRLKVGLIGSVTTGPEFRGRGMAKAVLEETVTELKRQGCVIAVLWSGQPEFYKLLGFHRAGRELDLRFSPSTVPAVESGVFEYDQTKHSHFVWRLYQKHDVRVDRSLEEQKELLRIPKARVFVTEKDGKVTSYVVVNKGADFTDFIHEWGGEPDELRRNVAWVQKRAFPERPLTLIAPYHYRLEALKQIADRTVDGVLGLVKVLDTGKLLALYRNYLRQHAIDAKWEGDEKVRFGEVVIDTSTDEGLLKAVFGGEDAFTHPALPFFLWGFDSI